MATAPDLIDETAPEERGEMLLADILNPEIENLVELLDETEIARIGHLVKRDFDIDEKSRKDEGWDEKNARALRIAMQVRKAKTFPWPGASNVKLPILTVACIGFQARAYPAIVDGSNLVKGRVLGPDQDGAKRDRAERIGQHMTWQLLHRMPDWEEDTDKLLLVLPVVGTVVRKTYYDPIAGANCSVMVPAEDFVINYWAKSLDTAPRYTHRLRFYPHEVRERVAAGLWRNVRLEQADASADDEQGLVEFYEQHRFLDLDKDGAPEPYVVTTTTDGEVARIAPCFGREDVFVRDLLTRKVVRLSEVSGAEAIGPVVRIERRRYFTKYGFIPAMDGSFYDIGYGHLLDDITGSIDTAINQMLDAATLQNAGGGFIGNGVSMRSGEVRFRIGEWKRVDVTNGTLRDNVFPMPAAGPATVLFSLLELLIGFAEKVTTISDAMTGEIAPNTPATTTLAAIEQAQKVLNGILKRIHRAFGKELVILRDLNRDNLDEEEYFQLNDSDPNAQAVRIGRADYEDRDLDVIPVSDPTMVSDAHRLAVSEAEWASFVNDPLVNQVELRRRRMEALRVRDIPKMLEVPAPAPDPMAEMVMKAEIKKAEADYVAKFAAAADKLANAAERLAAMGLIDDAASLVGAAIEAGGETDDPDDTDRAGGMAPMAVEPGDAGVLPASPASADGLGGGMGEGFVDEPGAPGAGGALGPVGGAV